MSELLAISGQTAHAIGIDAGVQDVLTDANRSHLKELFQEKASQWNTTLLITGKEDMIVSASKCDLSQTVLLPCHRSQEPDVCLE